MKGRQKERARATGPLFLPLVQVGRLVQEHQEVLVHPVKIHPITTAIIALLFAYGLALIYRGLDND